MKLEELTEGTKKPGTYSGVRFSSDTRKRIKAFAEEYEVPNRVPSNKLHTTVLYSRKHCPDYEPAGNLEEPLVGRPNKFEKWLSQPNEDGYRASCLVLTYDCPQLIARHEQLMKDHDASYDYDEYKPHVTLSYDVGREFDTTKLNPKKIGDIEIVKEYGEELNLDWAKQNTSK